MRHSTPPRSLFTAVLFIFALCACLRSASADPPIPSEVWVICKPIESLIVLGGRYHAKCETGWTNPKTGDHIRFFAIAATNSTQVEQAMTMVHTALTTGKFLRIKIKTGSLSNPAGCQVNDCRTFTAIGVQN